SVRSRTEKAGPMASSSKVVPAAEARRLYDRIGEFLIAHRLPPDPSSFAFAYHLLAEPESPLARAVADLTDGGARLTRRDIDSLGCDFVPNPKTALAKADALVASTQMQVAGFGDIIQAMHDEARGFGRDLAHSAAAIGNSRAAELGMAVLL